MSEFIIRINKVGYMGILLKADNWDDYEVKYNGSIQEFARELSDVGFFDEKSGVWYLPSSIRWVKEKK